MGQNQLKISSPKDFTAIGLLKTGQENHAVFIKSFNPPKWEVEIINSWGAEDKQLKPIKNDTTFYQVDLIRLTEESEIKNGLPKKNVDIERSSRENEAGEPNIVKMQQKMKRLKDENVQLKEQVKRLMRENETLKTNGCIVI